MTKGTTKDELAQPMNGDELKKLIKSQKGIFLGGQIGKAEEDIDEDEVYMVKVKAMSTAEIEEYSEAARQKQAQSQSKPTSKMHYKDRQRRASTIAKASQTRDLNATKGIINGIKYNLWKFNRKATGADIEQNSLSINQQVNPQHIPMVKSIVSQSPVQAQPIIQPEALYQEQAPEHSKYIKNGKISLSLLYMLFAIGGAAVAWGAYGSTALVFGCVIMIAMGVPAMADDLNSNTKETVIIRETQSNPQQPAPQQQSTEQQAAPEPIIEAPKLWGEETPVENATGLEDLGISSSDSAASKYVKIEKNT
jgi:hypothetical protein